MEQIRVNTGITVEVNEAGDTIRINVEDQNFIDKFYGMVDRLEKVSKEMKEPGISEMSEHEQLRLMIGHVRKLMEEIDGLFGEGSCKKIFGDIVPSAYLLADFFEQMTPIVERYIGERQKYINGKYVRHKGKNHVQHTVG